MLWSGSLMMREIQADSFESNEQEMIRSTMWTEFARVLDEVRALEFPANFKINNQHPASQHSTAAVKLPTAL